MLKGKTLFELTDVNSGEKTVIEENNMITNILNTFVQQTGVFNFNIFEMQYALAISDMKTYMAGGLMLFENAIEENPNIIYPPPNNRMTGQASNVTYTGNNLCAGSYNNAESGAIENGYKFVWDFTTHQANGQIGCACLTSREGGKLGAGCSLAPIQSDWLGSGLAFNPFKGSNTTFHNNGYEVYASSAASFGHGVAIYLDFADNCSYSFETLPGFGSWTTIGTNHPLKTGKFIIRKNRLALNNFSIFDTSKTTYAKVVDKFECSLPDNFVSKYQTYLNSLASYSNYTSLPGCMNEYNKHVYIYYHINGLTNANINEPINLKPNDEFMILDLDIEKRTLSAFTVINTTGQSLSLGSSSYYFMGGANPVYVTDKYILMHMADGCLYRISRKNNTDVVMIVDPEGNTKSLGNPYSTPLGSWIDVGGKLYGLRNPGNTKTLSYCLDIEEGVIYPWSCDSTTFPGLHGSNSSGPYFSNNHGGGIINTYGLPYKGLYFSVTDTYSNSGSAILWPFIFPHYLLTINNLEEPVFKTSAQTMKVTYIITDSYDEE